MSQWNSNLSNSNTKCTMMKVEISIPSLLDWGHAMSRNIRQDQDHHFPALLDHKIYITETYRTVGRYQLEEVCCWHTFLLSQ